MNNIAPILTLLNHFNPSKTALLEWLEPHMDDALLQEIAGADYGDTWGENFQALKQIHEQQSVPVPLKWVPREVVELIRLSKPDDPTYFSNPPISKGYRGHLIRAFSCTVLLIAEDDPEAGDPSDENITLIPLIDSVLHLGREATECALRFLSWRALRLYEDENENPFFDFSVLLLRAALFEPHEDGADLNLLAEWVLDDTPIPEEWSESEAPHSEPWLLGLTYQKLRHDVWKRVAQEVLLDPAKAFPAPVASALRKIVKLLVPETQLDIK